MSSIPSSSSRSRNATKATASAAPAPAANGLSKETIVVAGLHVHVYTKAESQVEAGEGPVVVVFLLHGRTGSARKMGSDFVAQIFGEVDGLRRGEGGDSKMGCDLCVVTIDQRNHGQRLVDKQANMGWSDVAEKNNERHAIDMYAIQSGTAQDVSHLIDFLPSYLFPHGERTVTQWVCAGKSLGGHSTWLALRNDPRITIGIPIIGCPDYLTLISKRAKAHKLAVGPPHIPDALVELLKRADPAAAPYTARDASNPFWGKKILVLSGKDDKIVPWSASQKFVEELCVGPAGAKEAFVEPGVGHEFSPAMVKELARFLWQHALAVGT